MSKAPTKVPTPEKFKVLAFLSAQDLADECNELLVKDWVLSGDPYCKREKGNGSDFHCQVMISPEVNNPYYATLADSMTTQQFIVSVYRDHQNVARGTISELDSVGVTILEGSTLKRIALADIAGVNVHK